MRSPSQPNSTPPVAAPIRNDSVMMPIHLSTVGESPPSSSIRAGRATSGNRPISKPSNIQPRNAASRAIHNPAWRASEDFGNVDIGGVLGRDRLGETQRRRAARGAEHNTVGAGATP